MFSGFHMFSAVLIWFYPIFTVFVAITRPDRLTKKEWRFLVPLTFIGAVFVTAVSLREADELLMSDGQEFAACTLFYRSYPAGQLNDIVKLKCGETTRIVNAEHYDDAIAAAKRYEDD